MHRQLQQYGYNFCVFPVLVSVRFVVMVTPSPLIDNIWAVMFVWR